MRSSPPFDVVSQLSTADRRADATNLSTGALAVEGDPPLLGEPQLPPSAPSAPPSASQTKALPRRGLGTRNSTATRRAPDPIRGVGSVFGKVTAALEAEQARSADMARRAAQRQTETQAERAKASARWQALQLDHSDARTASDAKTAKAQVAPAGGAFDLSTVDPDRSSIFVSLATFVDPECPTTLESLFANAANPERLRVGLVQQNLKPADARKYEAVVENVDCVDTYCASVGQDACRRSQIRLDRQDALETRGVTVARYDAQQLLADERFYLQVDSHTYFARHWDTRFIASWLKTGNPRAILTTYPRSFDALEKPYMNGTVKKSETSVPLICRYDVLPGGGGVPVVANVAGGYGPPLAAPMLAANWAAGQSFGLAQAERDAPYDKYAEFLFQGEEPYRAAQYWTRGYDFYTPDENLVFHHYRPAGRKYGVRLSNTPVWGRASTQQKLHRSLNRVFVMLGLPSDGAAELHEMAPGDRYGVGDERTLEQYFEFAQYEPATMRASGCQCSRRTRVPTRSELEANSSFISPNAVVVAPKLFGSAREQYCCDVKTASTAFVDGFVPLRRHAFGLPYVCSGRGECDGAKSGVRLEGFSSIAALELAKERCLARGKDGAVIGWRDPPRKAGAPKGEVAYAQSGPSEGLSMDELALSRVVVSQRFQFDSPKRPTVTCVVRTATYRLTNRARAVLATWGGDCDRIMFVAEGATSRDLDINPINIPETVKQWDGVQEVLRNAHCQGSDATEWYVFLYDTNYVVLPNLWELLADLDTDQLYLGRRMNRGGSGSDDNLFINAAAGIVLSRTLMHQLADELSGWRKGDPTTHGGQPPPGSRSCDFSDVRDSADVSLARCLKRRLDIAPMSTTDKDGGERFLPFKTGEHASMGRDDGSWIWGYSESKSDGLESISRSAVSFSDVLKVEEMFKYDIWLRCRR